MEDKLHDYETNKRSIPEEIEKCVELAKSAHSLYQGASIEKKRLLLRALMSNCLIREKSLDFVWQIPFREIAAREQSDDGRATKEMGRDGSSLLNRLMSVFTERPETELVGIEEFV